MSRSLHTAAQPKLAAFDFDVVTDVPARPAPKPEAEPGATRPDARPVLEKAKTSEA